MATTSTIRTYLKSEFTGTTPSGTPNVDIFRIEVGNLSLTTQPFSVHAAGNDILIEWSSLPVASDISTIDSAVSSHAGGLISGATQIAIDESVQTNSTITPATAVELTSGLLIGDLYVVEWYCETLVASVSIGSLVEFQIDTGSGYTTVGEKNSVLLLSDPFSGKYLINISDGDSIDARITFARTGGLALDASVLRCRILLTRTS